MKTNFQGGFGAVFVTTKKDGSERRAIKLLKPYKESVFYLIFVGKITALTIGRCYFCKLQFLKILP